MVRSMATRSSNDAPSVMSSCKPSEYAYAPAASKMGFNVSRHWNSAPPFLWFVSLTTNDSVPRSASTISSFK